MSDVFAKDATVTHGFATPARLCLAAILCLWGAAAQACVDLGSDVSFCPDGTRWQDAQMLGEPGNGAVSFAGRDVLLTINVFSNDIGPTTVDDLRVMVDEHYLANMGADANSMGDGRWLWPSEDDYAGLTWNTATATAAMGDDGALSAEFNSIARLGEGWILVVASHVGVQEVREPLPEAHSEAMRALTIAAVQDVPEVPAPPPPPPPPPVAGIDSNAPNCITFFGTTGFCRAAWDFNSTLDLDILTQDDVYQVVFTAPEGEVIAINAFDFASMGRTTPLDTLVGSMVDGFGREVGVTEAEIADVLANGVEVSRDGDVQIYRFFLSKSASRQKYGRYVALIGREGGDTAIAVQVEAEPTAEGKALFMQYANAAFIDGPRVWSDPTHPLTGRPCHVLGAEVSICPSLMGFEVTDHAPHVGSLRIENDNVSFFLRYQEDATDLDTLETDYVASITEEPGVQVLNTINIDLAYAGSQLRINPVLETLAANEPKDLSIASFAVLGGGYLRVTGYEIDPTPEATDMQSALSALATIILEASAGGTE